MQLLLFIYLAITMLHTIPWFSLLATLSFCTLRWSRLSCPVFSYLFLCWSACVSLSLSASLSHSLSLCLFVCVCSLCKCIVLAKYLGHFCCHCSVSTREKKHKHAEH